MKILKDCWHLMRPRQWVKNGFVLMGILFANAWRQPDMLRRALIATVAFSFIASGVYVMNDLLDRKDDLNHPTKKLRPLAAGRVSTIVAAGLLSVLLIAGAGLGFLVSRAVLLILLTYVTINFSYSLGLKQIVILDVFLIAAGFMLRILAGTLGIGIAPSQWLLICGFMVALFLGFAKRRAELYALSGETSSHRRVLVHYQPVFLDKMIVVTATCVIMTYSLYTMSPVTVQTHHTESLIYTAPFVVYGVFRYIYSLHNQQAGTEPATEIFRDPHILFSIAGWLLVTLWLISGH
ncbi:MAG TPA: decaprenyl-phosphate phosphoribosyltransferase [Pyrinomonadaceae bacterium]